MAAKSDHFTARSTPVAQNTQLGTAPRICDCAVALASTGDSLSIEEGSLYPRCIGWDAAIESRREVGWCRSLGRRAKFYNDGRAGRRSCAQLRIGARLPLLGGFGRFWVGLGVLLRASQG